MKRLFFRPLCGLPAAVFIALMLGCSGHTATGSASPQIFVGKAPYTITAPVAAADAPPQLVAIRISKDHFGSGDTVTGWAITSTNVASVTARVEGYSMPLRRDSYGHFSLSYTLPNLPSFVKRDYQLGISAANTAGLTVQSSLPIHVH